MGRLALLTLSAWLVARSASAQPGAVADRLALDATRGFAPQPRAVADRFRRANAGAAASFRGMLVCEVRVVGETWDGRDPFGPVRRTMGRVELLASVALPRRTDLARVQGPNDTNRVVFAVAGAELAEGEVIRFVLEDRDVVSNDPVGTLELTYEGRFPMRASVPTASLECRGSSEDSFAPEIATLEAAADAALARLARSARPDRNLVGFRPAAADPTPAVLAVYALSSVVGLADERFLARRDRLRASEVAFLEATTALLETLRTSATPMGAPHALVGTQATLEAVEYDCKLDEVLELAPVMGLDSPMECVLHAVVRARTAGTLALTFHLVDGLGRAQAITRFARVGPDGPQRLSALTVPAGETRLALPLGTNRGALLRIASTRRRSTPTFMALSLPTPGDDASPARPGRVDLRSRPASAATPVTPGPASPR